MSRVFNPAHYGGAANPYEAIKVVDAWRCNFNTGNAYKYMARAGFKPSADMTLEQKLIEDYEKAKWYLTHQLDRLEKKCPTAHQHQPLVVPQGYEFATVFAAVGFPAALEDAVRACFDQTSMARVDAGIHALTKAIEGLK